MSTVIPTSCRKRYEGQSQSMKTHYRIKPIGIIHSPFHQEEGTPIQPVMSRGDRGWVEVFPEFVEGLVDLELYDRVWLLFWCDRAECRSLTVTPYLDDKSHGIFSTRSPARPNPVGISCVRLVKVEGNRLDIEQLDILDGTPLLDIKPYIPKFDSYEVKRAGWYGGEMPEAVRAVKRFTR